MAIAYRQGRQALRCLYQLGPIFGFQAIPKLLFPVKRVVKVRLPGYSAPLFVRTGTADIDTFEKVFLAGGYDLWTGREPELIIDAGANIGCASVFFANKYPTARIIAIEPEITNFELLVRNTREYPSVYPINAALWHTKASLSISNIDGETDTSQVNRADSSRSDLIASITVDDILRMALSESIDIFKIDIESAEKELFDSDCDEWVKRTRIFAIEFHDRIKPGCSKSFYTAIIKYDFTQYNIGENVIVYK